jgi:hypothetical protein
MRRKKPTRAALCGTESKPGMAPEASESAMTLVRLPRYCQLTGDTARAVHDRRRRGVWKDGRHCFIAPGRRLWVNLQEVKSWITNQTPQK